MRIAGCLLSLSLAVSASAAIPDGERQALIGLYDATAGDSWTNKTGWKGAAGTECTWFGIVCSDEKTVVVIQMPSNNLTGTLPVLSLPNLRELNLESNHLSGKLPDLPVSVTGLLLKSNTLTGEIPRSILNLMQLGNLTLEFNGLFSHDPQVQKLINTVEGPVLDFQTVAPAGVVAKPDNRSTITVSWTPLRFETETTHYDVYSGSTLMRSVPYTSNV